MKEYRNFTSFYSLGHFTTFHSKEPRTRLLRLFETEIPIARVFSRGRTGMQLGMNVAPSVLHIPWNSEPAQQRYSKSVYLQQAVPRIHLDSMCGERGTS